QLPGMDRASILVVSARDEPDAILDALDAGANGYLNRPIDAAQLRARIEGIEEIERRAGAQPAPPPSEPEPATDHASANSVGSAEATLLDLAADIVLVVDPAGRVRWAGPSIERVLGIQPASLGAASVYTLCHPEDAARVLALLTVANDQPPGAPPAQADLRFLAQDGAWREMAVTAANLAEHPAIGGIALVAHDITERRAGEQAIRRQALYDPLTELPNRALFLTYLEHALARADRRAEPVVILFIDLDDLGRINERHGRTTGDRLLAGVGQRLRAALRATDTAARMGDDEFTILLEDIEHPDEIEVVANRVITGLRVPFEIADGEVGVTASIGVVLNQPASRLPNVAPGARLSELLRQADVALYRAKSTGKDRWVLYDSAVNRLAPDRPGRAQPPD
ncbi:MAG: diguanylate cyclase domain-containing protein, partial [Vicinamibacterales bacterium]